MKASSLSFQAAVVFVVAGMIWGIIMAISEDHSAMPAHAHLNLLGWVSLFLFGIYYRLHPSLENAMSALAQVWVWIIGTIILAIGVGLVHTGHPVGDPIAAIGSIVVLLAMLLFGWLVFQGERADARIRPSTSPRDSA
jgi:peptidoglycan/LPS O-acetylase OafA/YrhL